MTKRRLQRDEGRLHEQIARHLRNDIEAGVLRDGTVLPSSRDMAEEWGVSVFTISEAMKELGAEGLVTNKARSMRVVNSPHGRAASHPDAPPRLVLVGGYAGSGKTELGRVLARMTGWPIIDKDTCTRPIVEATLDVYGLPSHDRESDTYLREIRPREYEALMATAAENLECGVSVIVTAPFLLEFPNRAWVDQTTARCEALGAEATFVWLQCDLDTMRTYLRRRGAARDTSKLSDWDAYTATIDADFTPDFPHRIVENSASSEPLQLQARRLIEHVTADAR